MNIPVLETSRLILRGHTLKDFEACAAMWADPEVTRWIGEGRPLTREEAWAKFLRHPGHWALMGYGFWAAEEKSTGRMIGEAGFIDMKRDYAPEVAGLPEIGWALAPAAQGKGYATEAARECLVWGRGHFGPVRVVAALDAENQASFRVAEKCGFTEAVRVARRGRTAVITVRTL